MSGCHGTRPQNIGVNDGMLAPCPGKPNCVSSQADNSEQRVDPITLTGDHRVAFGKLKNLISEMPRVHVVTNEPNYLHAEFVSKLFRFVDDFEIYFNEPKGRVEIRSASRLGHSDMGVNRKRVETVRQIFADQGHQP